MAYYPVRAALHSVLLFFTSLSCAAADDVKLLREPVPLEMVAQRQSGVDTSRVEFAPDGQWIAYGEVAGEALDPGSTGTGVPPPLGQKSRIVIVDTRTGARNYLTGAQSWSWAPKWSPDGRDLAFYSDDGGQSRVWIWNKGARQARTIRDLAVMPANRSELVQWTSDGRGLVVKARPQDTSEAPARASSTSASTDKEQSRVTVLRTIPQGGPPEIRMGTSAADAVDLVEVDLATGSIERIARNTNIGWIQASPNGRYIGYTRPSRRAFVRPNGSYVAAYFDVMLHDRKRHESKVLAEHLALNPAACNWSPDSRHLACVPYRPAAMSREANGNHLLIVNVSNGKQRRLADNLTKITATSSGAPPSALWQADSRAVYVVGSDAPPAVPEKWYNETRFDQLWRVDLNSGNAVAAADLAGQTVIGVFSADGRTLWSERGARSAWVFAKDPAMSRGLDAVNGLYRINLADGSASRKLDLGAGWPADVGAAAAGNMIGYTADDLRRPADLWVFDPSTARSRQLTHLNPEWDKYELGTSHLLEYRDEDGRSLRAGLLLPPGYRPGTRVPLIVTVYGLARDSSLISNFALHGVTSINNMHVLSTRGYALLTPDMPLRQGTQLKDVYRSVMPAVDAAIAQGFVDPGRLAVMGYSFGAYTAIGLVEQTDRFQAVSVNGVSMFPDLFTDYLLAAQRYSAGNPSFYDDIAPYGLGMNGNPWQHRERYVDNSISTFFDKVDTPLLMAQGTLDGLHSSDVIFGALRALGKDVEYRIYRNEDHAISRRENVIDFWTRRLEFFDERLNIARNERGDMVFDGQRVRPRDALTKVSGRQGEAAVGYR